MVKMDGRSVWVPDVSEFLNCQFTLQNIRLYFFPLTVNSFTILTQQYSFLR
jgi:hypothetical protein